jgi:hypothetical protein
LKGLSKSLEENTKREFKRMDSEDGDWINMADLLKSQ